MKRTAGNPQGRLDPEQQRRSAENQAYLEDAKSYARKQISQVLFRVGLLGFVILCLFLAGSIFLRQQDEIRRVEKLAGALKGQWEEVVRESRQIEEQFGQIRSTEEIEDIARNELGLVKPGEIIFQDPQNPRGKRLR